MDHSDERCQEDLSNQLGAGVSSHPWAIRTVVDMRSFLVVVDEEEGSQVVHLEDLATLLEARQAVALSNLMVVDPFG